MSFAPLDERFVGRAQKSRFSDTVRLTPAAPPPYAFEDSEKATPERSRFDPRGWSRRTWILTVIGIVIVLIVVIVAAVIASKNNKYPAYSKLNYSLKDTYSGAGFFDMFDYFVGYDPSAGFVHYVDQPGSVALNLTFATATSAVLRVDTSEMAATTGRKSARITSKTQYNSGLFVFDIAHSPFGCGTWPAVWLADPANWPTNGEIDVVEAVNTATTGNQMTLHTTNDCSMGVKRKETGTVLNKNCYNGTDDNDGCGVQGKPATFGQEFNAAGGGVYAMEWRSDGIRVWFWDRSSIPSDTTGPQSSSPDPSSWGEALADFPNTHCNIDNHFRNQSIIANIDLCGNFAGSQHFYTQVAQCPGSCTDFVANNATAFDDAYWQFNSFKVYQAS